MTSVISRMAVCTAIGVCLLGFSGCGSDNKAEQPKTPSQTEVQADSKVEDQIIDVQLDYTVEKIGEHKYKISGKTNLPDGIEIMLTLSNQDSIMVENGIPADTPSEKLTDDQFQMLNSLWYRGQDKPTVKNGSFSTIFGGDKLNPGEYTLSITTPMWKIMQNAEVKEKLGENGKNLTGKGVVSESNGKRISLEGKIELH